MKNKNIIWIISFMITGMIVILIDGCKKNTTYQAVSGTTDYSQVSHWLSMPAPDKDVDVFYLYPTCWQKVNDAAPNICNIDDSSMLAGSIKDFDRQATAFEPFANVFAPYYRQADAAYTLKMPEEERENFIGDIPTADAVAAFDYFIHHFNQGRPFILAGHSQGSNILIKLLSGYMKENPDVYKRMIAAYVIGYPVTADYLKNNPHLKFATGPDDTGVIISYNTQAPFVIPPENPVVSNMVGLVINPITWTRTESEATTEEGLGSLMPDLKTEKFVPVPQYADARIDTTKGVLVCTSADTALMNHFTSGFGPGVYHSFDYPFYFFNLRQNAENRVNRFLLKK